MKKIIGYVTSQPFGGFCMPVPSQNSCLREYANKKNFVYQIPQLEHKYINCYMQLYTTINIAKRYDSIVMYSYEMLPINDKLHDLINLAFKKKIVFHFVLENSTIATKNDVDNFIRLKKIQKIIMTRKNLRKLKLNIC